MLHAAGSAPGDQRERVSLARTLRLPTAPPTPDPVHRAMTDPLTLATRPAVEEDCRFAFEAKRAALGAYVEQVWGWDEQVQRDFHQRAWREHRPDIIVVDGHDAGTLRFVRHETHYHLGEFYLLPEFQGRGVGSALLRGMLARADAAGVPARLDVIRINPARSLYERHGFLVCGETETHYRMIREAGETAG